MASVISQVNKKLKAAGREERLVRHGSGYYYVSGVAVNSGLYVYRLDEGDLQMALDHVEEVLTEEDNYRTYKGAPDYKPFKFA